jgi:hypothetical protein
MSGRVSHRRLHHTVLRIVDAPIEARVRRLAVEREREVAERSALDTPSRDLIRQIEIVGADLSRERSQG